MDYVELRVEQRIAEAIARGELDPGELKGMPIDDLDRPRKEGWWADQFVRRERSRFAAEDAAGERQRWERRLARTGDEDGLRQRVAEANRWIAEVNKGLLRPHAIERFDVDEEVSRWRAHR